MLLITLVSHGDTGFHFSIISSFSWITDICNAKYYFLFFFSLFIHISAQHTTTLRHITKPRASGLNSFKCISQQGHQKKKSYLRRV